MKQTAVDWLYNNLKSHFEHDGDLLECVQMSMQQAKEIEKEQTLKFGIKCQLDFIKSDGIRSVEDLYESTFNTTEK